LLVILFPRAVKLIVQQEVKKMASNTSNQKVVPEAKAALNNMKTEIANELGLSNYDNMDKGNLTSRQNGYVGGYITRNLVKMAEQQLSGK